MDILSKLELKEIPFKELKKKKKYCVVTEQPIDNEQGYSIDLNIWDSKQMLEFLTGIQFVEFSKKLKTSLEGRVTITQISENIELYNGSEGRSIKVYDFFEKK